MGASSGQAHTGTRCNQCLRRQLLCMCITKSQCQSTMYTSFLFEDLTIVIIFTDEDHWQVPKPSHVEGLKDLSLVGCTISVPAYVEVPSEGPFSIITAGMALQSGSSHLSQTYALMQKRAMTESWQSG